MREILFRGKFTASGMWIIGDLRQYPSGAKAIKGNDMSHIMEVDPDTIGQYTGLTDKNGKKIFEGDIVRFSLITGRSLVYQGLRHVTFNSGSFMIEDPYSGDDETISRIAASVELEIVGNVHDNPLMIADYIQAMRQGMMEGK